jgi:hypothetical protein
VVGQILLCSQAYQDHLYSVNKLIDVKSDMIYHSRTILRKDRVALVLGNHQGYGPTIVHFIERELPYPMDNT